MKKPEIPANEPQRLKSLSEYNILDSLSEKDFDDITRIASQICQTPISLVSLVDADRQWFKSHHGLSVTETPKDYSFCAHAILQPDVPFIIHNASKDERFADNPLVTGDPKVVFYAGVPLVNPEGYPLGTLCVIDNKPKQMSQQQIDSLKALANQVVSQLELRRKIVQLKETEEKLQLANQELNQFAHVVSHDLKSPLNNMASIVAILKRKYAGQLDAEGGTLLDFLHTSSSRLKQMIDRILEFAILPGSASLKKETVDLNQLFKEIKDLLSPPAAIEFTYDSDLPAVETSRSALQQILLNLCSNAIKYNNKETGMVKITVQSAPGYYIFQVSDNGPGIAAEHHTKIFELFQTLGARDRFNSEGTGIGLSIVKKLVEQLNGEIHIQSEAGKGTTFEFTIKN